MKQDDGRMQQKKKQIQSKHAEAVVRICFLLEAWKPGCFNCFLFYQKDTLLLYLRDEEFIDVNLMLI